MKLFDKNEKYIGNLQYVLEAKHLEEINGEDVLTLTTLDNRVEKGFRVVYRDKEGNWKEFIIKGIEEIKQPDGIIKSVYCESSFYETLGDYIEDKRPYNTTANIALERALEPTRWEVGIVDDLGINSVNFYHISAKEAVQKVAEAWKGEIRTRVVVSGNRIVKRYVDLLARRGNDTGKRFTYTKDIEEIKKIVHRDDVITALYGYGKGEEIEETGGYGRRITFGDINGGKNYVENEEARLIWGRNNPDGTKSHVFGKVEFDDVEDPEELLRLTKEKLEELSKPLISYECKVIDLKAYGFEHEGVELGDTVVVIDKDFEPELRLKARVISITKDLLEPENNEIILGNFIPSIIDDTVKDKEFINNFRGKQGVWDRSKIISSDLKISANYLNEIINKLNEDLNSRGGYVYLSEDGKGIITYDKPIEQEPTKAIQITGGAFRIANSKLPNGEWNWRTFGTGDGFVADLINTGTLNANLIKTGTIKSHNGNVSINLDDDNITIENGAIIIKDRNNQSIITANGLKIKYIFISSGELNGWQRCGIWLIEGWGDKHSAFITVAIPEEFSIETALLRTKSMPRYFTDWSPYIPDGFYHPRNLRLYKVNTPNDGYVDFPAHSEYGIVIGESGKTNITNAVWGISSWSPTGSTIQVREGDVKNYLQPGTNTFLVETTDAVNEDNARYGGAMQFELIVTGYLRG